MTHARPLSAARPSLMVPSVVGGRPTSKLQSPQKKPSPNRHRVRLTPPRVYLKGTRPSGPSRARRIPPTRPVTRCNTSCHNEPPPHRRTLPPSKFAPADHECPSCAHGSASPFTACTRSVGGGGSAHTASSIAALNPEPNRLWRCAVGTCLHLLASGLDVASPGPVVHLHVGVRANTPTAHCSCLDSASTLTLHPRPAPRPRTRAQTQRCARYGGQPQA